MAPMQPILGCPACSCQVLQQPTAAHAELPGVLMQCCRLAHHDHAFVVLGQGLHSTDENEEALHQPTTVGRQQVMGRRSLDRLAQLQVPCGQACQPNGLKPLTSRLATLQHLLQAAPLLHSMVQHCPQHVTHVDCKVDSAGRTTCHGNGLRMQQAASVCMTSKTHMLRDLARQWLGERFQANHAQQPLAPGMAIKRLSDIDPVPKQSTRLNTSYPSQF